MSISTFNFISFVVLYGACLFPVAMATDPSSTNEKVPRLAVISFTGAFVITSLLVITIAVVINRCCRAVRKVLVKKIKYEETQVKNGDLFSIWNYDGQIAFEDIIKATRDFDIKYCIGRGACGDVYKAKFPCGKIVAVKKFHYMLSENQPFCESFHNEVKILSEIRHRNIVKLHGFCLHKQCMFLVYAFMENGSLLRVLRKDEEAEKLNWSKRHNIVKGIAHALYYMHQGCASPILHRDITSGNILLNSAMEAIVSDFGIARLLDPDSSNQSLLVGTLETLMGKHPGELISCLSKPSTQKIMLRDILDARLPQPRIRKDIWDVILVVTLALACLRPAPNSRPSMKQVTQKLSVSRPLFSMPFNDISIYHLMSQEIISCGQELGEV